ncbi:MAG TPA: dolichyl-phosphate beta-glucosyltransferase [Chthoniobacterales bacterium]
MVPPFSLVIPAYNEAERISSTLTDAIDYLRTSSAGSEVIVVDDGSTDGTAEVVSDVFARSRGAETRLIQQPENRGKGAAVRKGLAATARPIALFSDADFSTPITEAPKLLEPINAGELEVAFGSRALDRRLIGSRQSWSREQGGRVFNLLVRLMTGLPYWDTQCGFKAFRMEAFRPILSQARSDGFGFDVELLYLAEKHGLRMREIPVRWDHNDGSKLHYVHDSLRMFREVLELRTRRA